MESLKVIARTCTICRSKQYHLHPGVVVRLRLSILGISQSQRRLLLQLSLSSPTACESFTGIPTYVSLSLLLPRLLTICHANSKSLQAEEWLYFHQGQARATVFLGGSIARTFDFTAGDTAVFPDNSGKSDPIPPCSRIVKLRIFRRPLHRKYIRHRATNLD